MVDNNTYIIIISTRALFVHFTSFNICSSRNEEDAASSRVNSKPTEFSFSSISPEKWSSHRDVTAKRRLLGEREASANEEAARARDLISDTQQPTPALWTTVDKRRSAFPRRGRGIAPCPVLSLQPSRFSHVNSLPLTGHTPQNSSVSRFFSTASRFPPL